MKPLSNCESNLHPEVVWRGRQPRTPTTDKRKSSSMNIHYKLSRVIYLCFVLILSCKVTKPDRIIEFKMNEKVFEKCIIDTTYYLEDFSPKILRKMERKIPINYSAFQLLVSNKYIKIYGIGCAYGDCTHDRSGRLLFNLVNTETAYLINSDTSKILYYRFLKEFKISERLDSSEIEKMQNEIDLLLRRNSYKSTKW